MPSTPLVAHICDDRPIADAALAAAINAASVISQLDTQTGLLRRDALATPAAQQRHRVPLRHWAY